MAKKEGPKYFEDYPLIVRLYTKVLKSGASTLVVTVVKLDPDKVRNMEFKSVPVSRPGRRYDFSVQYNHTPGNYDYNQAGSTRLVIVNKDHFINQKFQQSHHWHGITENKRIEAFRDIIESAGGKVIGKRERVGHIKGEKMVDHNSIFSHYPNALKEKLN